MMKIEHGGLWYVPQAEYESLRAQLSDAKRDVGTLLTAKEGAERELEKLKKESASLCGAIENRLWLAALDYARDLRILMGPVVAPADGEAKA